LAGDVFLHNIDDLDTKALLASVECEKERMLAALSGVAGVLAQDVAPGIPASSAAPVQSVGLAEASGVGNEPVSGATTGGVAGVLGDQEFGGVLGSTETEEAGA